ncbi:MAG: BrnT family toxin [Hyphomicrobiaceae bacterium]
MENDEFEWDDIKAEANLRKHKISFRAASRVFEDALTERDSRIRIISARKANSDEQRAYGQS